LQAQVLKRPLMLFLETRPARFSETRQVFSEAFGTYNVNEQKNVFRQAGGAKGSPRRSFLPNHPPIFSKHGAQSQPGNSSSSVPTPLPE
jgi:hypothetical protein